MSEKNALRIPHLSKKSQTNEYGLSKGWHDYNQMPSSKCLYRQQEKEVKLNHQFSSIFVTHHPGISRERKVENNPERDVCAGLGVLATC